MSARDVCLAVTAVMLAGPAASAQTTPWSVSVEYGTDRFVSGQVHRLGEGTLFQLAPTTVFANTYDDVYEHPRSWAIGVGYARGSHGEIRVRLFRSTASAVPRPFGVLGRNLRQAPFVHTAAFDEYRATGVEVGYRRYAGQEGKRARLFGGASAGVVRVGAIAASIDVPSFGARFEAVDFYKASTVPAVAAEGGIDVSLGHGLSVQATLLLRWHGPLAEGEGLMGPGLSVDGIRDGSRRWSMPLTLGAAMRF